MSTTTYYARDFPSADVFAFCTLHHERRPENREVAVTNADDVWKRYNSVRNEAELRQLAVRNGVGATLHLGPHYTEAAAHARRPGVAAVGKQLPFDLDLTDVSFLGIPKSDQSSNDRFVRLIFGQVHILRAILREVFGFEHFLPVYSGRRGVHLWVLDARADALGDEARKAICAMISPPDLRRDSRLFYRLPILQQPSFTGGEVEEAVNAVYHRILLAPYKQGGVGLFDSRLRVESFLDKLFARSSGASDANAPESRFQDADAECERRVRLAMNGVSGPTAYRTLEAAIRDGMQSEANRRSGKKATPSEIAHQLLSEKLQDVMFSLVWPSLDVGPSAQMGHCVKLPFSEHGSTGRISLPIEQLLPVSGGSFSLPPIVTAADLQTSGEKRNLFDKSVAVMRSAVAFARKDVRPAPSLDDIEDLGGRASKSPRSA
jgi:DNA primase small subunit